MKFQVLRANQAAGDVPKTSHPKFACVRTAEHSTVQGELVWEDHRTACVRVFSKLHVGRRI